MEASTKKVLIITGVAIATGVVLGGVIVLIQASTTTLNPGTVPTSTPLPSGPTSSSGGKGLASTGGGSTRPTTTPPAGARRAGTAVTAASGVWDSIVGFFTGTGNMTGVQQAANPPSIETDPKDAGTNKTGTTEHDWWRENVG